MKSFRDETPHDLLGVGPNASPDEIRQALDRLARVLAPGSLALYSVLGREEQRELHENLHIAGALLLARHEPRERLEPRGASATEQATVPLPLAASPHIDERPDPTAADEADPTPGARLRAAREKGSQSLHEVSQRTRIPLAQLAAIEDEAFDRLPMRAYLRGFVMTYAQALKLDPESTWQSYRAHWEAAGYGRDPASSPR